MCRIIIISILFLFSYNTSLGIVYYVNENDSVAKKRCERFRHYNHSTTIDSLIINCLDSLNHDYNYIVSDRNLSEFILKSDNKGRKFEIINAYDIYELNKRINKKKRKRLYFCEFVEVNVYQDKLILKFQSYVWEKESHFLRKKLRLYFNKWHYFIYHYDDGLRQWDMIDRYDLGY